VCVKLSGVLGQQPVQSAKVSCPHLTATQGVDVPVTVKIRVFPDVAATVRPGGFQGFMCLE
jgi:hypothetical protein